MIFKMNKRVRLGFLLLLMVLVSAGCGLRLWPWNANSEAPKEGATSEAPRGTAEKIPFPRPASHDGKWLAAHGATVDVSWTWAGEENLCLTCHRRNDCIECHNTWKPVDHNNAWRTRTHGLMAAGNRERCLICHRQDYCVSCHDQTAPRTHRGNWRDRHCTWCHFDSGLGVADNCIVCHRGAPHTSAPHTLVGREDCTLCH